MARPQTATVLAYTSSGVPFQWLMDGYSARGARDANQEVLQALVDWSDSTDFLRDVVGYSEWDGTSSVLNRVLPHQCPFNESLWCESYQLMDMGCYDTREVTNDPFNENVFVADWLIYQLVFTRPPYWVRSDATLTASYDGIEKNRYCSLQRRYQPRESRRSGYGFEYLPDGGVEATPSDWKVVPDEAWFIPDYSIQFLVKLHQWPTTAVPEKRWAEQLLTVNDEGFELEKGGFQFEAETLLFKGPAEPISWHQGADGAFYVDTTLVFDYRPGGWNSYLRPDLKAGKRDYGPVRRRKTGGGGDPPYPLTNLDDLFVPGNT